MAEYDYEVKVALIEQEIDNFKTFFDRLDFAIEKIGTVSSDIRQMLAVHEEKISVMDEKIAHNKQSSIMVQEATRQVIKDLNERITTVNKELTATLSVTESKIIEKQTSMESRIIAGQNELKEYFVQSHTTLEQRVKTLENWRYVLVGIFLVVGVVIGFVANNSVTISKIGP